MKNKSYSFFSNLDKIQNLKDIIYCKLEPIINNDFVLLDVPNHRNIGDSLIWQGELNFFEYLNFNCLGQFNADTFDFSLDISKDTVILMHGGGNFGDLYRKFQNFRLKVIKNFPNNRIVILPQTVFYENFDLLDNDLKIMSNHKDLYICVRDKVSESLIKSYFDPKNVLLMPDMAFFLDFSIYHNKINNNDNTLFLKRTDKEFIRVEEVYKFNDKFEIKDWPTFSNNRFYNFFLNKFDSIESRLSYFLKFIPLSSLFINSAYGLKSKMGREKLIDIGVDFFLKYNTIYTSRLHGLILGILLDKEVYIIDNSYGKNHNFYEAWLFDFEKVYLLN
ncbi:exopolysaccharide biosynthesis protein [Lacihabitans sp. LS3-19]|uniref:polysaccharide pyruvyl transferase family protein n=1 Tax=Lacihabitans sp. LS3-19 TaxID=2487335 RepID=UPI0020CC7B77|nr:polysaccharide pyruvyl transferase family protein [Lacihabitans sp. LS3-19]MCP9769387.1 exopolysaccharide biosynthesis protein [Lacihabitans sp. LS3-19]